MSGFSNYAISLSIICILAGGMTSFQVGFAAWAGPRIGLGWPLVCAFSLVVALTMGRSLSVSDGGRFVSLGFNSWRQKLGLGDGVVQFGGLNHDAGGDQCRRL